MLSSNISAAADGGPPRETPDVETSSSGYAQRFSGKIGAWLLQVQENATTRMLRAYSALTVLDVGGGHGQLTPALIERGFKVTVLGSAPSCSERIQAFVAQGSCKFEVGDVVNLPYPDQAFDIVLAYRLVSHVNQWEHLLSELSRVARQAVFIDYPRAKSVNALTPLLFGVKRRWEGNTRTYTLFHDREIKQVFSKAGFRVEQHYAEFFWPMVLHRLIKSPALSELLEALPRLLGLTALFGSPVIMLVTRERS